MFDFGTNLSFGKKKLKFEKLWLGRSEFKDIVEKAWNTPCTLVDPMDVWQFSVRTLRRIVRCWADKLVAELNRHKQSATAVYNALYSETKSRILDEEEKERMKFLATELDHIWGLEEIRARQRARDMNILEGDRNITYFHVAANQRCRKKMIESLRGPYWMVHDTPGILKIAADYYKNLFS
jgi:hypothetical protein